MSSRRRSSRSSRPWSPRVPSSTPTSTTSMPGWRPGVTGTRPSATGAASMRATRTATASARCTSTRWRASGRCCAPGFGRTAASRRKSCRCTGASSSSCTTPAAGAKPSSANWWRPWSHELSTPDPEKSVGTYPNALNRPGEPAFRATPGTPTVSGLTAALLTRNPNKADPRRLGRDEAATCDMDHGYTAEQQAFDGGLMDKFVEFTAARDAGCDRDEGMNYFDGNTVTALWNYAQHFAMSDNSFGTGFGPSTPGALNLVAGNTHGAEPAELREGDEAAVVAGTVVGDPDPQLDD